MSEVTDPVKLLGGLVLDDEATRWGQVATSWQRDDAESILLATAATAVRMFFNTRPRGGSKTTDLAAVLLVVLLTQAPRRSTSHAYARDEDQAGLLLDALRGIAERSGLAPLLEFGATTVTVKATRAVLRVESADAGSAYGRIPYFVVCDELAQWPTTRGARALWEAIISGIDKKKAKGRSIARLVVLTSAGDPAHWAAKVIEAAKASDHWRVSEVPGPLPWMDPADLAEQQRLLPSSVYARLHLNVWTASEDRLVSAADLRACVVLDGPQPYDPAHRYMIGLDLGLKNDRTVMTVAHSERQDGGVPRIVLDRLEVLQGTRARPVNLGQVERLVLEASRAYGHAKVRTDPWQAAGLAQRLRDKGINVEEFAFSAQSVGRLGQTLHLLLRDHRLALPDDEALLDELMTVRLRESAPGVYRLDHDSGNHDDRAVSLGLAALALVERAAASDYSTFSIPGEVAARMGRTLTNGNRGAYPGLPAARSGLPLAYRMPMRGPVAALRRAAGEQTEAMRRSGFTAIPVEGTANDPSRGTREPRD